MPQGGSKPKRTKTTTAKTQAGAKPKPVGRVRKRTEYAELIAAIKDLTIATQELRDEMEDIEPPKGLKKFFGNLVSGLAKGVGFILGTTIVAAILIIVIIQIVRSPVVQNSIGESFSNFVESSLENVLPVQNITGS